MRSKDEIVNELHEFLEELHEELMFNLTPEEEFLIHRVDERLARIVGLEPGEHHAEL